MKTLKEAIQDYLVLRRGLGFKLKKHSRLLKEFALFLEQAGTSQITTRLTLQWATKPQHIQQVEWAARLSVVRGFARYWSATDRDSSGGTVAVSPQPSQALPLFR